MALWTWRVWCVPLACLLGGLAIAIPERNRAIFQALNAWATHTPEVLWEWLTTLGDTMAALCFLLILARRRPDIVLVTMIAALVATVATHLVKDMLDLARPAAVLGNAIHIIGPHLKAGAFPSGHTATVFTLAAVLAAYLRSGGVLFWVILGSALIGLSRITVGAHWPLDVLGGALMGWCSGLAGVWLHQRMGSRERPRIMAGIQGMLVLCALYMLTFYDSGYARADLLEKGIALSAIYLYWRSWTSPPYRRLSA